MVTQSSTLSNKSYCLSTLSIIQCPVPEGTPGNRLPLGVYPRISACPGSPFYNCLNSVNNGLILILLKPPSKNSSRRRVVQARSVLRLSLSMSRARKVLPLWQNCEGGEAALHAVLVTCEEHAAGGKMGESPLSCSFCC